jgi:hypothetical protein
MTRCTGGCCANERHHAEPQPARRRAAGRDQPALGHLLELAAQRRWVAAHARRDLGGCLQRQAQPRRQRRLLGREKLGQQAQLRAVLGGRKAVGQLIEPSGQSTI